MKQFVIGLAICAMLVWAVWRQPAAPTPLQHREFFALGTLVQISIADPMPSELGAKLQERLNQLEARWSPHSDGELAQLNRALASADSATLPPVLRDGFQRAQEACLKSGGLFDPAMGDLVRLWGFDDESRFRDTPPAEGDIRLRLANRRSLCDATLGDNINVGVTGVAYDFGASAKGRAVNEVVSWLQANGIRNAIVNAGGDLKAIGQRPDRPWRIGIRHPRPEAGEDVLASLTVKDGESVFSSGDYERFFIFEGRRYHHIIDPRTGYPATGSASATVVLDDAEMADAAATALFVAGPELAAQTMMAMGVEHWLLVDATGELHASDSMRARLDLGS